MERVIFLVEHTGERIPCLLNPESLELRRTAGLRTRQLGGSKLVGKVSGHDPWLATGGGRTELTLDLLFDVSLAPTSAPVQHVQELTGPLWRAAQIGESPLGPRVPPVIRLIWGLHWNMPAIVAALSERIDRFSSSGLPLRSWLRLSLVQVDEETAGHARSFRVGAALPIEPEPDATLAGAPL